MEDEDKVSDATEEAKFSIELKQTKLDDVSTHEKVENDKKIANKEQEEEEYEDREMDKITLQIEKERKIAESILDKEVKEIEEIHLHTLNVH